MTGQPSSYNCKNGCKFHKTQNCPAYLCDKTMICIVGCASHSAFSIPPEGATPENECFCVSKCDPKNCGTALCKCSECWNPATSLGCDGNWQTAHNAAIAQAAREEVLDMQANHFSRYKEQSLNQFAAADILQYINALRQSMQKKEVPE